MNILKLAYSMLPFILTSTSCFALQSYPLIDHQSTTITISDHEHNRIAVLGDRIHQIFGTDGPHSRVFDVQSDEERGQIVFKLANSHELEHKTSKPIPITIITEGGLTQDLKLIPKSIDSQSILFRPAKTTLEESSDDEEKPKTLPSLISLIKTMIEDKELHGSTKMSLVQNDRRIISQNLKIKDPKTSGAYPLGSALAASPLCSSAQNIKIDPLFLYKGEDLEGKVYVLTNQGKNTISLKEPDFALPGDLALAFEKILLPPGHQTKLYVVTKPIGRDSHLGRLASGRLVSGRSL